MSEIEWAEPPTAPNEPGRWTAVADELRANPGRWAKIKVDASDTTLAHRIKHGAVVGFRPAGAFEARSVSWASDGKRRFDIYARYVGEQVSA